MKTPVHSDAIGQARQLLPTMPQDVFDWFCERIEMNGWPPDTPIWHNALLKHPFSFWQCLLWVRAELNLTQQRFSQSTLTIIDRLQATVFDNVQMKSAIIWVGMIQKNELQDFFTMPNNMDVSPSP
jgi:hypothetical protein